MKPLKVLSLFVVLFSNCFAMEQKPIRIKTAFTFGSSDGKIRPNGIIDKKFSEDGKSKYTKPHIVMWGIGPDGVTDRCVKFNCSIMKQLKVNFKTSFMCFMYDLSAWNMDKWNDNESSFLTQYPYSQELLKELGENATIIYSSNFFKWLFSIKKETVAYIENNISCDGSFAWKYSESREGKIFVNDTYLKNTELFKPLGEKTIESTYSFFQYLECFFIIQALIEKGITDIIFFLPNDELSYYLGKNFENMANFTKDVNAIVALEMSQVPTTTITFIPFSYGAIKNRPYTKIKAKGTFSKDEPSTWEEKCKSNL